MSKEQNNDIHYDNRICQRSIREGKLDRAAFEKFIAELPDMADACTDIGEEIYGDTRTTVTVTGDFTNYDRDDEA
jgi:hypothetical protein